MRNTTILLFLFIVLSSCSFNKAFYQYDKLPAPPTTLFIIDNPTTRPDTTLIDVKADNFQPLFMDTRHTPKHLDYTVRGYAFKSSDGNKLAGWLFTPITASKKNISILLVHGNGGNLTSQMGGPVQLAKQGFTVFLFDYSGYGFSEGSPTRKRFLQDGNSALDYMLTLPEVKGTKIVVYGQSLGGHLSATIAAQNEKKIDGLVIEGAPSSHKDIAAHLNKSLALLARILVHEGYAAKRSIRHYHKPLLLIYSSEDKIVPMWMGRKLYDNANEPKSFYEVRHPHISGLTFYADSISQRIIALVAK